MVEFERNRDSLPNLLANKNICARYLRFIVYLKLKFNWPSQYFIQQPLKVRRFKWKNASASEHV